MRVAKGNAPTKYSEPPSLIPNSNRFFVFFCFTVIKNDFHKDSPRHKCIKCLFLFPIIVFFP